MKIDLAPCESDILRKLRSLKRSPACSEERNFFFSNQLKQRNCPEISHQKNCRGHNIKNTIYRRDQNESPSNISSKCGRISSLRRAKRSLPNTNLSNFEVQHSIIQLGNVFCSKTPLSRQFIFLQIDCVSEIRWPPKHKSFPNLQARLGWKKHSLY